MATRSSGRVLSVASTDTSGYRKVKMKSNKLKPVRVTYGTDPEGFITQNGKVIGSEKIIPVFSTNPFVRGIKGGNTRAPLVIVDGVQFELNPTASTNLRTLARSIGLGLEILSKRASKLGAKVDLSAVVDVDLDYLLTLEDLARIFGCAPSKNIYGEKRIKCDPKIYPKRSAGGHMHFGLPPTLKANPHYLVTPLDIFVGLPSVLIDRDPQAAERRVNYGRAGEYRTPPYGLEYRTLSNFWLANYSYMSLVFGLADIAISICHASATGRDLIEQELVDAIDLEELIYAIDKNDKLVAERILDVIIVPFLKVHLPDQGFILNPGNVDKFADWLWSQSRMRLDPNEGLRKWVGEIDFTAFDEVLAKW